jgi:3-oxoacyl-[acyl-carrier-protein] synthase-3
VLARFKNAAIHSIAIHRPEKKIRFADESYGEDESKKEMLTRIIGLDTRYVSENETTLDLCESAVKKLEFDPALTGALVFVTQTPDYFSPGNAYILHGKLGLPKSCACFDINAGCTGYVQGLMQAFMLLENTDIRQVLLCVGDTISKAVNPSDSATAPLFGDAGSATLVVKKQNSDSYFQLGSAGVKHDKLMIREGAFRVPGNGSRSLFMDGIEVMHMTIGDVPSSIRELISFSGINQESINYFFFHQANKLIVETLASNLKIPKSKAPVIFGEFGNQSSASIPFAIVQEGQRSRLSMCMLSGFGVGFSWASTILALDDTKFFL